MGISQQSVDSYQAQDFEPYREESNQEVLELQHFIISTW